jgi:acetamidase/formamidase
MAITHDLPLERRSLHGHFSRDLAPVLSIDRGDSVRFRALDAGWHWDLERAWIESRDPVLDDGHALCGPIEVRGARAGATLVVDVVQVTPRDWGITFAGETSVVWRLDATSGTADDGTVVALAPFLGVVGMPPAEAGVHSTIPPRRSGGNIDCKELTVGARLFLPIEVDGALVSAGDGHAAQGDGEVSGTAIECPLDAAELRFDVREDITLRMPIARTDRAWIAFGFDRDLDVAADLALQTMLDLIEREHGVSRDRALALASVCVDLRVTQIVNESKGVHAVLRHDALRGLPGREPRAPT